MGGEGDDLIISNVRGSAESALRANPSAESSSSNALHFKKFSVDLLQAASKEKIVPLLLTNGKNQLIQRGATPTRSQSVLPCGASRSGGDALTTTDL